MSKNSELIELTGQVIEVLPNSTFRVNPSDIPDSLLCYIGGKLKKNKIKVILGDVVKSKLAHTI